MHSTADFSCYLVAKQSDGAFRGEVVRRTVDDLPPGEVLMRTEYSSLNYKDALSATGNPGVSRTFPHVPGIDAAGTVVESAAAAFRPGDRVIVTGRDQGQNRWGGWAGMVRVPADWVLPLPTQLDPRTAMIYGTAGLTAAQAVEAIELRGAAPDRGEAVVTGASGGVGCLAVALLAKLGYRVAAVTGKPRAAELLRRLGAEKILSRADVDDRSGKPLLPARFAAAVDTVGGNTLSTIVRSMQHRGVVTACGLVGGAELPLTVFPFILRGVDLVGIDSAECPVPQRTRIWAKLADAWSVPQRDALATEITLDQVPDAVANILRGAAVGRTIIRHGG